MRSVDLLLCAACLGGCAPRAPAAAPVTLALGTRAADGAFTPLADGTTVVLVEGAQGGFHVWMSWALGGATAPTATLERTAWRLSDDALVLRAAGEIDLADQSRPLPMFMCPSPVGLSVIDQPIVFRLRFSDDSGPLAAGEVTLVPRCPDGVQADFCHRICSG
jgi:hypothetical protein